MSVIEQRAYYHRENEELTAMLESALGQWLVQTPDNRAELTVGSYWCVIW